MLVASPTPQEHHQYKETNRLWTIWLAVLYYLLEVFQQKLLGMLFDSLQYNVVCLQYYSHKNINIGRYKYMDM